ncbi:MAG: hypothetical protein CBD18_05360 [Opitutales bacterium TMED158]|nr:MAG: hypothetical protein CBD18_05360 [Opitutales bacterium TMED158]
MRSISTNSTNEDKPAVLVFGCGAGGLHAYNALQGRYRINGFLDNDEKKQGREFCGKPVYSPQAIPTIEYDRIVVASQYSDVICLQLVELGIPESKIELLSQQILLNISDNRSLLKQVAICGYLAISSVILWISAAIRIAKAKTD